MNATKLSALLIALASLSLAACQQKGPGERAGEKVDHAVDTLKNGGEEPTRDKLQDETDRARDKLNDAGKKDH